MGSGIGLYPVSMAGADEWCVDNEHVSAGNYCYVEYVLQPQLCYLDRNV